MIVGIARIYDMLNDPRKAFQMYKQVLTFDNNSIESIASIASYHFYTDQPEIHIRPPASHQPNQAKRQLGWGRMALYLAIVAVLVRAGWECA